MHRLVLGNPIAALVAPILLGVLAHKLLNKGRASARGNAEDPDPRAPAPSAPPIRSSRDGGYDVFLSFRGGDSRRGFADFLYDSLVRAGILVFRDDEELRRGESIDAHLLKAIENCKILIPIISENYGSSKWCLQELVHMMNCKKRLGRTVLPVFYRVEPEDVEHLTGSFGEAFHHYHSRRNFDQRKLVEEWKQALREVSSLPGLETQKVDYGREGAMIEWIVPKVLKKLKEVGKFNLVGMESHVEEIMKSLKNRSGDTLYLGIHGIGGIGKTTLAKVIYNKLSNLFEHRSFIADVRESCTRNGIEYLQNQLIADILRKIQLDDKYDRFDFISSKFKDKKVLVLLDDVDRTNQLEALAGNHKWFAPGSRIIVTTRDRSVLDTAGVDIKYELEEMNTEQSLILFSRHAFQQDSPPREFFALSGHVVSMTGGLPLLLEAVGSFLYRKDQAVWIKTIQKMQVSPHDAVQDKLMISYEALERDQKEIFLDIACFLIGSDARVASYMWDACGFFTGVAIEVLRSRSFVNVENNHELRMHDHLRDLGRKIVLVENYEAPHKRSRLWNHEEALSVLERKKGTETVQALCLAKGNMTRIADEDDSDYLKDQGSHIFTNEQLKNLPSLRFLHMSDANLVGDFNKIFSELRWLKWGNCSPSFAAKNFHPGELVILDLSGSLISDNWQGWSSMMMAEKLKVLNLTGCRSLKTTFYLSAFQSLEILILRDCGELEQIDPCIGDVKTLISLDLRGCSCLQELPPQMGKLERLKELLLDQTMIQEIPSSIGSLKKLETLSAKDCQLLLKLPNSIGSLGNLRRLSLGCCRKLREIPDSIGKLEMLTQLDLSWTRITELPKSLGDLQNLEVLDIGHSSIEKLPDGVRRLKSSESFMPDGA